MFNISLNPVDSKPPKIVFLLEFHNFGWLDKEHKKSVNPKMFGTTNNIMFIKQSIINKFQLEFIQETFFTSRSDNKILDSKGYHEKGYINFQP